MTTGQQAKVDWRAASRLAADHAQGVRGVTQDDRQDLQQEALLSVLEARSPEAQARLAERAYLSVTLRHALFRAARRATLAAGPCIPVSDASDHCVPDPLQPVLYRLAELSDAERETLCALLRLVDLPRAQARKVAGQRVADQIESLIREILA